jgi:hypothetical protein
LAQAESLAKSSLKKEEEPKEEEQKEQAAAPEQEAAPAPAEEAPQEAPPAPEMEAQPPQEEQPQAPEAAPEQGDEALQEEGHEDQPLTDEELTQIYSSMSPDELERHFSVMRQVLGQAYAQDEQQAPQMESQPAPEAAPEAAPQQDDEMQKSESKISALEKKIQEQDTALKVITQAFETLARPQRKSVTDMQFIAKGEETSSSKPMTSEEIRKKANDLAKSSSLSKSEREMINRFFLYKEGADEVTKLINSKGGK